MTDLHRRFASLDAIPARLDWGDVERRLVAADATSVSAGRPTLRRGGSARRRSAAPSRGFAFFVAAAIAATVAGGAVLVGSGLLGPNNIQPGPSSLGFPSPSPSASPARTPGAVGDATCPEVLAPDTLRTAEVPKAAVFAPPVQVGCSLWSAAEVYGRDPAGLNEFDLRTGAVTRHLPALDVETTALDGQDLWILARSQLADSGVGVDGALLRVSTDNGAILQSIPLTSERTGHWLRVLDGRAWLGGMRNKDAVYVIELATGRDVATVHVPGVVDAANPVAAKYVTPVAVGPEAAWTITDSGVIRIDSETFKVMAVPGTQRAWQIVVAAGWPYYTTPDSQVVQLDPGSGMIRTSLTFDSGVDPGLFLAPTGASLWTVTIPRPQPGQDGSAWASAELVEIDAASGEVLDRIPFERPKPVDLYATPGTLWLSVLDDPLVRIDLPVRP